MAAVLNLGPSFAITPKVNNSVIDAALCGVHQFAYQLRWRTHSGPTVLNQHETLMSLMPFKGKFIKIPPSSRDVDAKIANLEHNIQRIYRNAMSEPHHSYLTLAERRGLKKLLHAKATLRYTVGDKCGSFVVNARQGYSRSSTLGYIMKRKPSLRMVMVALVVSLGGSFHFGYQLIPSVIMYSVSRVTMGFSVSLSLGLAALFLSESSPKECRGAIGMITGTCVQFGTVVGSILAMPQILGTFNLWPYIYVSEIGMMLGFAIFLPFLPETPGFLVQRGALEAAKKSLMFYYKCDEEVAEKQLSQIKEEQKRYTKIYTMTDVMKKGSLRKKTFIGMVVMFAMSFSGVSVINAYAVEILISTGLKSLEASLANVGIALVSVFAIVISSMVVDKFGRRPLLLMAFVGCLICNLLIFALMLTFDKTGNNIFGFILIFVICVFIVFFAIGPGPLCYFITAELVGQAARSGAQSWTSVVQMLSRFVIVTIFLPMKNGIGESWSYLILFVAPVVASVVFLYFKLPETKNKTPTEMSEAEQLDQSGGAPDAEIEEEAIFIKKEITVDMDQLANGEAPQPASVETADAEEEKSAQPADEDRTEDQASFSEHC
ncbi:MFS transporter, SP family [Teladorsagia circumcincta]|uniref:MFS transporter, SP family n=1 Tax=Teladorsagia circumcincta TaxID=45464 RepID=A0A2G9V359_TELCI|nr:MFS transporter, SP family [Teladorsagia circumcincta]